MIEIINNLNYVEYLSTLNACLIEQSNINEMIQNANLIITRNLVYIRSNYLTMNRRFGAYMYGQEN